MTFLSRDNNYYRKLIVQHFNEPQNKGLLELNNSYQYHHTANSCVDDFYIELTFVQEIVTNAKFNGVGCAISTAAIDIFCTFITNKNLNSIKEINNHYRAMLNSQVYNQEILEDLNAFANVLKQPNRLRCALIISDAITQILTKYEVNKC